MKRAVKFERRDWEEIVAALESKITMLERGDLGPEDRPGQDRKWLAHLRKIIRKIEGPKSREFSLAVFRSPVVTTKGGK